MLEMVVRPGGFPAFYDCLRPARMVFICHRPLVMLLIHTNNSHLSPTITTLSQCQYSGAEVNPRLQSVGRLKLFVRSV